MPTRRFVRALFLVALLAPLPLQGRATAQEAEPQGKAGTFRNPLKIEGADPWLMYHDGWYYLATTTAVDVRLRRARRIGELKEATDRVVWKDDDPTRNRDVWAPEFHRLDGGDGMRWYLYFTATDGQEPHHRMYVVRSEGDDPMGPYTFKAKLLTDPEDREYAIDGTVLTMSGGRRYFIWSGRPSPAIQGLRIAKMENPWTLTGPRRQLPASGFGCDKIREGPVALRHGDRIFLIYSACPTDLPDYKLGMLSIDPGADPMDLESWHQHPDPILTRNDDAGVFGPGHCSFFKSPDGREDWIAYHAKTSTRQTYADRTARAQRFRWKPDGTPDLGRPLPTSADIPAPSGEPAPARRPAAVK